MSYIPFIFPGLPTALENLGRRNDVSSNEETDMRDAIFLCAGLAFFAVAIGYTMICEKL